MLQILSNTKLVTLFRFTNFMIDRFSLCPIDNNFEEEFGNKSDYFNHRIGLFMEMKNWIVKQFEDAMLI